MPVFLVAIVAWFGEFLASSVARFIAMKILLTTLFVVVLPIILNNLIVEIMTLIYEKAMTVLGDTQSALIQLTGLAAYLADLLQLPLFVSILLGAVSVSFTLNLLRVK